MGEVRTHKLYYQRAKWRHFQDEKNRNEGFLSLSRYKHQIKFQKRFLILLHVSEFHIYLHFTGFLTNEFAEEYLHYKDIVDRNS